MSTKKTDEGLKREIGVWGLSSTMGFLFAVFGGFRALAVFSVAGALLSYMAVSLAVLKFRGMPEMKQKGFTIPGGSIVPVLSVAICLFFLYHLKAREMISVVVFFVAATILYWGLMRFKGNITGQSVSGKLKTSER